MPLTLFSIRLLHTVACIDIKRIEQAFSLSIQRASRSAIQSLSERGSFSLYVQMLIHAGLQDDI